MEVPHGGIRLELPDLVPVRGQFGPPRRPRLAALDASCDLRTKPGTRIRSLSLHGYAHRAATAGNPTIARHYLSRRRECGDIKGESEAGSFWRDAHRLGRKETIRELERAILPHS